MSHTTMPAPTGADARAQLAPGARASLPHASSGQSGRWWRQQSPLVIAAAMRRTAACDSCAPFELKSTDLLPVPGLRSGGRVAVSSLEMRGVNPSGSRRAGTLQSEAENLLARDGRPTSTVAAACVSRSLHAHTTANVLACACMSFVVRRVLSFCALCR